MVKKKTTGYIFCLFPAFVIFAMLLTSCGSSSSDKDTYAKSINMELINALNNKDAALLKSMMSIRAKNVEDLDDQISQLFEFVDMNGTEIKDENIIRSECMLRHAVDEGYKKYDYLRCDLRIKLDNGKQYYFFTHTYRTNKNEWSVGVCKIVCYDVSDYVFKEGEVTIDTKGLEYVLVGEH